MSIAPTQGPGSTWAGPLISGTKKDADDAGPANSGLALLSQTATLTPNGSAAVSAHFALPKGSQVVDIIEDTTTAWNAGTSDELTVGTAAAGTQYASAESVGATGRVRPAFTAAQLAAMANIGSTTDVYATVTPTGAAPTAGSTTVTILYVQTVQAT